jgi:hypothetical protein
MSIDGQGRRAGWWVRLCAILRAHSLDGRLLAGEDPGSSPVLRERRAHLLARETRRRLAAALERAVADADREQPWLTPQIPLRRREIHETEPLLISLSRDLEDEEPVNPRGVILIWRLLHEGDSPLYAPTPLAPPESLDRALRHARAALHLR